MMSQQKVAASGVRLADKVKFLQVFGGIKMLEKSEGGYDLVPSNDIWFSVLLSAEVYINSFFSFMGTDHESKPSKFWEKIKYRKT